MALQRVPINNFRGGLNTRDGPFDLQPNESPDLLNVTLTSLVGQLQMRAGKTAVQAATPGVIDNCKQIQFSVPTTVRWLMCSIGGKIYSCDANGVFTLRFTGTAGTVWTFEQMPDAGGNDKCWCVNGVDAPQKWDGVAAATSAWAGTFPGLMSNIRVWRNRMCLHGPSLPQRLFLSKPGDPEQTTGAFDFVDLRGPEDSLALITDMQVFADRLFVFKKRSTWVVNDPATFANRRIGEPGCWGRFQSVVCEEKLYFFNEQGIWSTGGVAISYESGSINNYFPNNLNLAALDKVRLTATRDSYPRVLVSLPTGASATNNVMVELVPHINFRRIGGRRYLLLPAFMIHSFAASSLAPWQPANEWGIYGGDGTLSKLYHYFNGSTDDGASITAHWTSSWMAIQGEEPFERIRRANLELLGDVTVSIYKDFDATADFTASLVTGGAWDGSTWDSGEQWDTSGVYRFQRVRPESRGRFHQVRLDSVAGGVPFQVNVVELAVRGGKEH